jgi:hypothetical protein
MSSSEDTSWGLGRTAWERLTGWARGSGSTHPDTGEAALNALDDISLLRRLLDQAELEAVRTARRHRRSWSEIATTPQQVEQIVDTESVLDDAVRELRRASRTRVPDVVGMNSQRAIDVLGDAGLRAVSPDPDGPPLDVFRSDILVTDQSPEAGARVPPGTHVRLWTSGRGGGAGVREPRRPKPKPPAGQAVPDLAGEQAG